MWSRELERTNIVLLLASTHSAVNPERLMLLLGTTGVTVPALFIASTVSPPAVQPTYSTPAVVSMDTSRAAHAMTSAFVKGV
jgi:hypothetical protein